MKNESNNNKNYYSGDRHCKAVRFEVMSDEILTVFACNCSICLMKQNHHFIVNDKNNFKLLSGENELTTYTFNTKTALHMICRICGVQAFYQPRSHPNGFAVTIYCLDNFNNVKYKVVQFNGKNWEDEITKNEDIIKVN